MIIYGINPVLEALRAERVRAAAGRRARRQADRRGAGAGARAAALPVERVDRAGARSRGARRRAPGHRRRCRRRRATYSVGDLLAAAGPAAAADRRARRHRGSAQRRRDPADRRRRGRDTASSGRRATRRRSTASSAKASAGALAHVADRDRRQHRAGDRGAEGRRRLDGRAGGRCAATLYTDVDWTLPTALVLGAEGTGLRRLVRERCDRLVSDSDGGDGGQPECVGRGGRRAVSRRSGSGGRPARLSAADRLTTIGRDRLEFGRPSVPGPTLAPVARRRATNTLLSGLA